MKVRTLGKDLTVSAVGLGCMGFSHAYGAATKKSEAVEAIQKAFEMGYTFFDTAESCLGTNADGSISYNEELIGETLSPYRNKVQLVTKFGVRHDNRNILTDSRPEIIRSSIEGRLRRLHTDYIDDIELTAVEVMTLNKALDGMEMSEVFFWAPMAPNRSGKDSYLWKK